MQYLKELLDQHKIAGRIAEIGTLAGEGSTRVFLNHVLRNGGELYAIDIFPDPDIFQKITDRLDSPNTEAIRGYSVDVAKDWAKQLDFLFIDGDHGFPHITKNGHQTGVMLDILAWHLHIKPGGILAFHDYTGNQTHFGEVSLLAVETAVDCLCNLPAYQLIGKKGSIIAFRKLDDILLVPQYKPKIPADDYRTAWQKLDQIAPHTSDIIIYGTGGGAKYVYDSIVMHWPRLPKITFTDSFVTERGTGYGGNPVIQFTEICATDALIVIGSLDEQEIMEILNQSGRQHLVHYFKHFEFVGWCHLNKLYRRGLN